MAAQHSTYPLIQHPAPIFTLADDTNQLMSLDDLMGEQGLLMGFVYGTYCPTCLETYHRLALDGARFTALQVQVALASLDDWRTSQTFKRTMRHPLPFPILSDVDGMVHKQYNSYHNSATFVFIAPNGMVVSGIQENQYPGTRRLLDMCIDSGDIGKMSESA
jgi:peroxiredoxin